uniref:Uncharacterized protein n=1 Tax=Aegilops tauschii TaxID=37682 RepID=M8CBB5_AEGTA
MSASGLGGDPDDDIDGDEKESMPNSPCLPSKNSLVLGGYGAFCAEGIVHSKEKCKGIVHSQQNVKQLSD